jgi:hypothetical protein
MSEKKKHYNLMHGCEHLKAINKKLDELMDRKEKPANPIDINITMFTAMDVELATKALRKMTSIKTGI